MHLGMSDLSILRFARKAKLWLGVGGRACFSGTIWPGFAPRCCWCIGCETEALIRTQGVPPGPMVDDAVGWAGLICIVIAGWTTANPTIYRAGLAFQGMLPENVAHDRARFSPARVATAAGVFPAFAMQLLDFVGIYGTILAPVGAIIVVDHSWLAHWH